MTPSGANGLATACVIDPRDMSIPQPPDPVTYTYVGVCAGVSGALTRSAYAWLRPTWRWGRAHLTVVALFAGGLYGLTIWVIALLGGLAHAHGQIQPVKGDVLTVSVGLGGLMGFFGASGGLYGRWVLRRDISPQDWVERFAGSGILFGFLLCALVPGLHS
jgi:hypothetical protein